MQIDKFYILGYSIGGYTTWSCLNYTPQRLSGAALIAPLINYWWPCFPRELAKEGSSTQLVQDQRTLRIAHYPPWLFNWWMSQKWFASAAPVAGNPAIYSRTDLEILKTLPETPLFYKERITQQGEWEFDPTEIKNPFPDNEGSVHIWIGFEDRVIPYKAQRYIVEKLPWIRYHELADGGHFFVYNSTICDAITRALVTGSTV